MHPETHTKLERGLIRWMRRHEVTPENFAGRMSHACATAWDPLRGKGLFIEQAFGRFALAYGTDAAAELLSLGEPPLDGEGN